MSFYISLSGLKAAQSDLSTISNNVANAGSTSFKRSRVSFGDIFASAPMQTTTQAAGQGVRQIASQQQFTQGTLETSDKTLDLAITGEGFFTVQTPPPGQKITYTRNGAFGIDLNRFVVDTTGSRLQVLEAAADGTPVNTTDLSDLVIPLTHPDDATVQLSSVGVSETGLVTATFADGSIENLGIIAMATFPSQEGLRQQGDAHWTPTQKSGEATYGPGNNGLFGSVRSGTLERSNVDITEELVALISAQRNFQANSKAIETASSMTQSIINLRT